MTQNSVERAAGLTEDQILSSLTLVRRRMKRLKPHYWAVIKEFLVAMDFDREWTDFTHRVHHGFYAETAQKLGLAPNTVKRRLAAALGWCADQLASVLEQSSHRR